MLDRYVAQVHLLLTVLPEIARETAFALKGGTAINLFYRDLPRLSVDLDLTWLPVADRRSCRACRWQQANRGASARRMRLRMTYETIKVWLAVVTAVNATVVMSKTIGLFF